MVTSTSAMRLPAAPCQLRMRPTRFAARHAVTAAACEGVGEGDELAPAAVDGDGWADPVEDGAPPTLDCGAGRNCRVPTANRTAIALSTPIHSGTG